jgi:hypothetical protein
MFAAELASGAVPSIRRIRREMHVGQSRAEQVQAYLTVLAPSTGDAPSPVTDVPGNPAGAVRPRAENTTAGPR